MLMAALAFCCASTVMSWLVDCLKKLLYTEYTAAATNAVAGEVDERHSVRPIEVPVAYGYRHCRRRAAENRLTRRCVCLDAGPSQVCARRDRIRNLDVRVRDGEERLDPLLREIVGAGYRLAVPRVLDGSACQARDAEYPY